MTCIIKKISFVSAFIDRCNETGKSSWHGIPFITENTMDVIINKCNWQWFIQILLIEQLEIVLHLLSVFPSITNCHQVLTFWPFCWCLLFVWLILLNIVGFCLINARTNNQPNFKFQMLVVYIILVEEYKNKSVVVHSLRTLNNFEYWKSKVECLKWIIEYQTWKKVKEI